MAGAETVLTVLLLLGIVALGVWIFSRAIRTIFKLITNSIGGLFLLFLVAQFGPAFGVDITVNLGTIIFTLFTGVFGVVILIVSSFIF